MNTNDYQAGKQRYHSFSVMSPKDDPLIERENWRLPVILFVITIATTIWAGVEQQGISIFDSLLNIQYGIGFSMTLLLILGIHEFGHYFFCKRYHIPATVPYFIPMPNILGTLGAFIRIKGMIPHRRALLDIGMAGPLAGFMLAFPATVIGYLLSEPIPVLKPQGISLGNSILTWCIQSAIFPNLPDQFSILLHPIGFAGYIGLLVTAINLIPLGQLDGGHIASALFGIKQWNIAIIGMTGLFFMGFYWSGWWFWFVLLLLMGFRHPVIAGDAASLGTIRTRFAWLTIVIFVLTFVPTPFIIQ